jgi:hypothetical protein
MTVDMEELVLGVDPESKPDFIFKNQHGVGRPGLNSAGKPCLLEYAGYPVIDGKINGIPLKEFRERHRKWMLKRKKGEAVSYIFTGK